MTQQRFRTLISVLCALAAGTILRLFFLHRVTHLDGDPLLYGDIAKNWLTHGIYGRTFTTASGMRFISPTLIRLPGYPAFLALCFALFGVEHYRAVCFVQVAIDLAGCLLIARRCTGPSSPSGTDRALAGRALSLYGELHGNPTHRDAIRLLCCFELLCLGSCSRASSLAGNPGSGLRLELCGDAAA